MNDGSASKHRLNLLVTSVSFVLLVASASARSAPPAGDSWQQRTALLAFRNLPKRYTCDQLRERVRDVLIHVGARPDVQVSTSRCERMLGVMARSPRVRVRFFVPAPSTAANTRQATIEPGVPASLEASDCALVRQMLTLLPGKVLRYRLACRSPSSVHPAFTVTVQALWPPRRAPLAADAGEPRG
jgi:hypothetical protein